MALYDSDKHSEDRGSPMPNHSDVLSEGAVKAHKTISSHYTTDADTSTKRLQMQNKQIVGSDGAAQVVNFGVQTDDKFAEDYFTASGTKLARFGQQADGSVALKFFDANGVGVARFGQYSDGTIALKVAKSGQEVDTATGNNLIFNSAQDVFKIVAIGTTTLTVPNPITSKAILTATIPHNLGTTPAFLVYATTPSSAGFYPTGAITQLPVSIWSYNASAAGNINLYSSASADNTNLYINIANLWSLSLSGAGGTWTFKYYILQETAT